MLPSESPIHFGGEEFTASTQRSLYHKDSQSLIIADCHFGKAMHFRKNALPIPSKAAKKDYLSLQSLLVQYSPKKCIILGDLFHSEQNREWDLIQSLLFHNKNIEFVLIEGNHDILPVENYTGIGFSVLPQLNIGKITCTHEPYESEYNLCGHIHPGHRIRGKGRQQIMMRCFFIGTNRLIMPSFGDLTGRVHVNKLGEKDRILAFTEESFFDL